MKKSPVRLLTAALAVMAVVTFARSETVWFDAGISGYGSWPDDGTDFEVEGVGTWTGTGDAELVGEPGAKSLLISTAADRHIDFEIESPRTVASETVTVRTSAKMQLQEAEEGLALPAEPSKCALTCATVDGEAAYYGLVRDPGTASNVWQRLTGAVPDAARVCEVAFELKAESGAGRVRYSVDGQVLRCGTEEWLEVVFPAGDDTESVSTVSYIGTGEVTDLAGFTETSVPTVALTIPAIEHVSVASVKANGVAVEPEGGVYRVQQGAIVVVRFEPDANFALTSSSMKFVAGTADMTLPENGRPTAVGIDSYITINEIMASNGTSLSTKGGKTDIDWVELYNSSGSDLDLSGWYLGNDPTKKAEKWSDFQIKGSCVVPANGYKIVWCDGDNLCPDDGFAPDEAFVRCNVSTTAGKHTVFLASAADADSIVEQILMPGQMKDVSYGFGNLERTLLGVNDAAEYRVGGGEWTAVRGPVGKSSAATGFTVTSYKSTVQVTSIDVARSVLADPSKWLRQPVVTSNVGSVAYQTSGAGGVFGAYGAFPDGTEDVVLVVEGAVEIPESESGLWTFAVGSDDGFSLVLSDSVNSYSMEYATPRGYSQTTSCFSMAPGSYNLKLIYFDRNGGAAVDLSVAEGDFTTSDSAGFNTTDFTLVGSAGCPVLHGGALSGYLAADVGAATTAFDWRANFTVADLPEADDTVTLRVRYADGFTARVNGQTVATVAPDAARMAAAALEPADFAIPAGVLVAGENTIEISAADCTDEDNDEMFLSAQVVTTSAAGEFVYFRESTPGKANTTHGYGPMTPEVQFSEPHGYKTEAFELTLSCADAQYAPIYYTLDGTSPTAGSTLYTGPIHVSATTCIRAAVPQDNTVLQYDCAATYIFLDDVLETQLPGVVPDGFPANGAVNGHAMRYGLSRAIVNGADRERLLNGFTNSIATFSVVVDPKNLFDQASGIYVNPSGDGKAWERKIMLEQINPKGGDDGFSVPAGIRIRGAASRGSGYAKHSLRFFFRGEYGMGSLEYRLFGDEGTDEFDKVDLRTSQNYSWANENSDSDTFIHECFSRDSQGAMGEHYTKSRYYNLFINGQYWGLYQTEERGDEDFAEAYNGGASGNYDVIKTSQPGYVTGVSEGTEDAWKALWTLAVNGGFGPGHEENYMKALGRNADGTRNEAYPVLLNPTNVMVYMLSAHFTCDSDSPASVWGGHPNNIYALRDRVDGDSYADGFFFLRHDAEHSMGVRGESNANADPTNYGTENYAANFAEYGRFNPAELHWKLCENADYRRAFADLFYKHFIKKGGAMTAPVAVARFESRMAEIDDAIVCEAARWSQNPDSPKTRQTWINACNGRLNFINNRLPYMIEQYQNRGWYPRTVPATAVDGLGQALADGTTVAAADRVYLTNPSDGTVYYTTDGSDPLLADGTPSDSAVEYEGGSPTPVDVPVFGKGSAWKYYQAGNCPAANWTAADYDDSGWSSGNGKLGFAGSGTFGTPLNRYVGGGSSGTQITTFYFRKSFDLPANAASLTSLKVAVECDDAYAIYVNGRELRRENLPSGSLGYDTFSVSSNNGLTGEYELTFEAGLLQPSGNVIAVEVHQCNGTSTDAWWDGSLSYARAGEAVGGIAVPAEGVTLTMRVLSSGGTEWSAMDTVSLKGEMPKATPAEALRILEVMSNSPDGDTGDYLVLTNTTSCAVDLAGVKLVAWNAKKKSESDPSLTLTFDEADGLSPNAGLRIDPADFDGKLTDSDVGLRLYDADASLIQDAFVSADWFDGICDGEGAYFIAKELGAEVKDESQWRPSETWAMRGLRVYAVMSSTPDGDGDGSEFIVLTNVIDHKVGLAGANIWCAKEGNALAELCTLADGSLKAGESITLDKATYWPDGKITNGKVNMELRDGEGEVVQTLYFSAKWFDNVCDGNGSYFVALEFGDTVTKESQWTPVALPAYPEAIEEVVETNEAVRAWVEGIYATPEGKAAVDGFSGTAATVMACYLADVLPEADPEIAITIPSIGYDDEDRLVVGGAILIHGSEPENKTVNGMIRLYHATALEALKDSKDSIDLGHEFPVPVEKGTLDLAPAPKRFFRLKVE